MSSICRYIVDISPDTSISSIRYTANKWQHKTKHNFRYYLTPITRNYTLSHDESWLGDLVLDASSNKVYNAYFVRNMMRYYNLSPAKTGHYSSYKIPYTRAYRRYDLLTLCLVIVVHLYHVQHCIGHYRCLSQYYNVLALFQEKYDTTNWYWIRCIPWFLKNTR